MTARGWVMSAWLLSLGGWALAGAMLGGSWSWKAGVAESFTYFAGAAFVFCTERADERRAR